MNGGTPSRLKVRKQDVQTTGKQVITKKWNRSGTRVGRTCGCEPLRCRDCFVFPKGTWMFAQAGG